MNKLKTLFLAGASAAAFSSCQETQEIMIDNVRTMVDNTSQQAFLQVVTSEADTLTYELRPIDEQDVNNEELRVFPIDVQDKVFSNSAKESVVRLYKAQSTELAQTITIGITDAAVFVEKTTGKDMYRVQNYGHQQMYITLSAKRTDNGVFNSLTPFSTYNPR